TYEPNNIEQIVFSIAIGNPNEITKKNFLIYGQIIEVVKKIEERSLEKTCKNVTTKPKFNQLNDKYE
ncbi:34943_t:CDS:1, partial [Racocetra persica]